MKKILISMMMAAASLGMMAQADAASGYVNVEDVLSSTPAFMQAGKTVVLNSRNCRISSMNNLKICQIRINRHSDRN